MDWNTYFFNIIKEVRKKSKDRHTQVGCVIVGPDHEIRVTGYNSLPMGVDDSKEERYQRPLKYDFFEHSERNAIYLAARIGTPLKGCTLYLNGLPCCDCARGIIQSGISRVIYDMDSWAGWCAKYKDMDKHWTLTINNGLQMMREAGVVLEGYRNGVIYDVPLFPA